MTPYSFSCPTSVAAVSSCLIIAVCVLSGCTTTHTKFLSDHWVEQPSSLHFASSSNPSSRLQVIITYDGPVSSHSALRLESASGDITFWDPAGAYGLVGYMTNNRGQRIRPYGKRVKDIVVTHVPDIPTYLNFRWLVGDSSVEVFEWELTNQETDELQKILREETGAQHPQGPFQTETAPAFCSLAISDFLQRFGTPTIQLADTYLWPHNRAESGLHQSPARVRVFHHGETELVFIPPLPQMVGP